MEILEIGKDLFIANENKYIAYVGGLEKLKEDLAKAPIEYITTFVESNLPIVEFDKDRAMKLFQDYKQQYLLYSETLSEEESTILSTIEKAIEDESINLYHNQINLIRQLNLYDEDASNLLVGLGVVIKAKYLDILKKVAKGDYDIGSLE